jgi:hypothetical protein
MSCAYTVVKVDSDPRNPPQTNCDVRSGHAQKDVSDISTGEIVTQIGGKYSWSEPQQQRLKSLLVQHQASIQGVARGLERSAFSAVAGLIVVPILAMFFLSDGANMVDWLIRMVATNDKDVKSFEDMHGLQRNPFLRNLDEGRLIARVEIEKGNPGEDDDWIIFTFGDADPAVSPYRPPDTAATGQ